MDESAAGGNSKHTVSHVLQAYRDEQRRLKDESTVTQHSQRRKDEHVTESNETQVTNIWGEAYEVKPLITRVGFSTRSFPCDDHMG